MPSNRTCSSQLRHAVLSRGLVFVSSAAPPTGEQILSGMISLLRPAAAQLVLV